MYIEIQDYSKWIKKHPSDFSRKRLYTIDLFYCVPYVKEHSKDCKGRSPLSTFYFESSTFNLTSVL